MNMVSVSGLEGETNRPGLLDAMVLLDWLGREHHGCPVGLLHSTAIAKMRAAAL